MGWNRFDRFQTPSTCSPEVESSPARSVQIMLPLCTTPTVPQAVLVENAHRPTCRRGGDGEGRSGCTRVPYCPPCCIEVAGRCEGCSKAGEGCEE